MSGKPRKPSPKARPPVKKGLPPSALKAGRSHPAAGNRAARGRG